MQSVMYCRAAPSAARVDETALVVAGRSRRQRVTIFDNLLAIYFPSRRRPPTVLLEMLLQNGCLQYLIATIRSADRGVSETIGVLVMLMLTIVVSGIIGLFVLSIEG